MTNTVFMLLVMFFASFILFAFILAPVFLRLWSYSIVIGIVKAIEKNEQLIKSYSNTKQDKNGKEQEKR